MPDTIKSFADVVKLMLKGEVGVCALNSNRHYIVDRGKSWKNHGIVFLNFCGNPDKRTEHKFLRCRPLIENSVDLDQLASDKAN